MISGFHMFEDATGAHCYISAQVASDGELMLKLADGTNVATVFVPPDKVPCVVGALTGAVGETCYETTSKTERKE